jgi:hypothetical protein
MITAPPRPLQLAEADARTRRDMNLTKAAPAPPTPRGTVPGPVAFGSEQERILSRALVEEHGLIAQVSRKLTLVQARLARPPGTGGVL